MLLAVAVGVLLGLGGIQGWFVFLGRIALVIPYWLIVKCRQGFALFGGAMAVATLIALKATGWVSEDMLGAFCFNIRLLLTFDFFSFCRYFAFALF